MQTLSRGILGCHFCLISLNNTETNVIAYYIYTPLAIYIEIADWQYRLRYRWRMLIKLIYGIKLTEQNGGKNTAFILYIFNVCFLKSNSETSVESEQCFHYIIL